MKLYIRQKVFSWGDRFTVRDETGADRYTVRGEVFSLGHRLHLTDPEGRELVTIRQKLFSFRPRYFLLRGGFQEAELIKEFTLFRQSYRFDGRPWRIDGNFTRHEYTLTDRNTGAPLMTVGKEWFTWGDSYVLDIAPEADEALCVAALIAIDCANADDSRSAGPN